MEPSTEQVVPTNVSGVLPNRRAVRSKLHRVVDEPPRARPEAEPDERLREPHLRERARRIERSLASIDRHLFLVSPLVVRLLARVDEGQLGLRQRAVGGIRLTKVVDLPSRPRRVRKHEAIPDDDDPVAPLLEPPVQDGRAHRHVADIRLARQHEARVRVDLEGDLRLVRHRQRQVALALVGSRQLAWQPTEHLFRVDVGCRFERVGRRSTRAVHLDGRRERRGRVADLRDLKAPRLLRVVRLGHVVLEPFLGIRRRRIERVAQRAFDRARRGRRLHDARKAKLGERHAPKLAVGVRALGGGRRAHETDRVRIGDERIAPLVAPRQVTRSRTGRGRVDPHRRRAGDDDDGVVEDVEGGQRRVDFLAHPRVEQRNASRHARGAKERGHDHRLVFAIAVSTPQSLVGRRRNDARRAELDADVADAVVHPREQLRPLLERRVAVRNDLRNHPLEPRAGKLLVDDRRIRRGHMVPIAARRERHVRPSDDVRRRPVFERIDRLERAPRVTEDTPTSRAFLRRFDLRAAYRERDRHLLRHVHDELDSPLWRERLKVRPVRLGARGERAIGLHHDDLVDRRPDAQVRQRPSEHPFVAVEFGRIVVRRRLDQCRGLEHARRAVRRPNGRANRGPLHVPRRPRGLAVPPRADAVLREDFVDLMNGLGIRAVVGETVFDTIERDRNVGRTAAAVSWSIVFSAG